MGDLSHQLQVDKHLVLLHIESPRRYGRRDIVIEKSRVHLTTEVCRKRVTGSWLEAMHRNHRLPLSGVNTKSKDIHK